MLLVPIGLLLILLVFLIPPLFFIGVSGSFIKKGFDWFSSKDDHYVSNNTKQCPSCNSIVSGNYKYCPFCQTSLNKTCANCGAELSPQWKYCPHCGQA